jgi:hypothetical protein
VGNVRKTAGERRSQRGRPTSATLEPEHAALLRSAVRAFIRYFGIRLQDLGGKSNWLADAMRKERPISVATALRILDLMRPTPELIGKKKPQGQPVSEVVRLLLDRQGDSTKLPSGAAADYWINFALATTTMERYVVPIPGTALFVLPGAARPAAVLLAESLPFRRLSPYRRRVLVEHLSRYFSRAEGPLRSDSGKTVATQLAVLGIANTEAEAMGAFNEPNLANLLRIPERLRELRDQERRRTAAQKASKKHGARKKRNVTLQRISDVLR